jgi:transposase
MRFAGVDVAAERHYVAVVGEAGGVLLKATAFFEEATGYRQLRELLGNTNDCLIAMEATGHYWRNLFAYLTAEGFSIALLNPLRARRFAEEDLARTKTDAIDPINIVRFAAQKRPVPPSCRSRQSNTSVNWSGCGNRPCCYSATACATCIRRWI